MKYKVLIYFTALFIFGTILASCDSRTKETKPEAEKATVEKMDSLSKTIEQTAVDLEEKHDQTMTEVDEILKKLENEK